MGIFKSGKIDPQRIVDGAISGIDKAFFSKEEKADQVAKIVDAHADFVKSTLNSSTTSSKARRYVAISIITVFLILTIASAAAYYFSPEYSEFLFKLAKDDIGTLSFMVAGFYFGGYMVSNHFLKGFKKEEKK